MLTSLKNLYKIGPGPSSSHTMGPSKAAIDFKSRLPKSFKGEIICTLYGSLALTGHGHMTDVIIKKELSDYRVDIVFDMKTQTLHPNTLLFKALEKGKVILEETYLSIGGGTILRNGETFVSEKEVYNVSNFEELKKELSKMSLVDYVHKYEDKDIDQYLLNILDSMFECIERGINKEGYVAFELKVKRVSKMVLKEALEDKDKDSFMLFISAYAYAVSEENADGGIVVTSPTCGSSGILPAILYYLYKHENFSKEKLIEGLMIGGLIGLVVKHNATISGAVGGCQAEVGTATSMASAALTYLQGLSIEAIEYSSELAMEHSLGLTCDPVNGYVAIPCIERNAVGALKAYEAYVMAKFIGKARKNSISFDEVVKAMAETGKSLSPEYKETSLGGLAKVHRV